MTNLDGYRTGNKGMDDKIQRALRRELKEKGFVKNPYPELLIPKRHKYGVAPLEERTYKDGTEFASKGEMVRWDYLLMIERAGEIKDLQRQVPFVLQEGFISKQPEWGEIEPLIYVCDFLYVNISFRKGYEGRECVEDYKGAVITAEYKLKRKLFLLKHANYAFFEVTKEDMS